MNLYETYGAIDEVNLETNKANIMQPYSQDQPIEILVEQLEHGRFFAAAGHQQLHDHKLITKGVTLLANTSSLNQDIQEWQRLPVAQKTWQHFQTFFQQAHKDLRKTIITVGQGDYIAAVNTVYGSVIHQDFPQDQQATYNL